MKNCWRKKDTMKNCIIHSLQFLRKFLPDCQQKSFTARWGTFLRVPGRDLSGKRTKKPTGEILRAGGAVSG